MCGRCVRLGHRCRYSAPTKQNPSQTEMSRLLMTLHSRLAQTEARLAGNPLLFDQTPGIIGEPDSTEQDLRLLMPLDSTEMQQQVPRSDIGSIDNLNINEQMFQPDLDIWLVYTRIHALG